MAIPVLGMRENTEMAAYNRRDPNSTAGGSQLRYFAGSLTMTTARTRDRLLQRMTTIDFLLTNSNDELTFT